MCLYICRYAYRRTANRHCIMRHLRIQRELSRPKGIDGKSVVAEQISIEIAPFLQGQITQVDLMSPIGSLAFWNSASTKGTLFSLKAPGYELEAGVSGDGLYIRRNTVVAKSPVAASDELVNYFVTWAPTFLRSVAFDHEFHQLSKEEIDALELTSSRWWNEIGTPPTLPPISLIAWAREQAMLPVVSYASAASAFEAVVLALQGINDTVETVGMQNSFWDIGREGNRIVSKVPKYEPDIQHAMHACFLHTAMAKTLEVAPEHPTGGGNVDFLFSAPLDRGGMTRVCVEVKRAHSADLVHGLTEQLPNYMRSKGCVHGVYVVLDFRGTDFDEPRDLNIELHLHEKAMEAGVAGIRVVVLSLGRPLSPSRR